MKLMIMLLISLLLAADVEAAGSKKKCTKCEAKFKKAERKFRAAEWKFKHCETTHCPSPSPPPAPPLPPPAPPSPPPGPTKAAGTFTSKDSLKKAVKAFNKKPAEAEKKYGPIAGWDVSGITDMSYLFSYLSDFNADISNWNTSGVTDMSWMFFVRSPRVPCTHSPPAVAGRPRARPLRPLLPSAL